MHRYLLCAAASIGLLSVSFAQAEQIYGLTNLQQLVQFDSVTRTATPLPLNGFSITGELLVSIDQRPATGELYGLSNSGQVYKLNTTTGNATTVGAPLTLTGNLKAIDFNPTVDRIRVLTSSGQNLRVHPDTGALASTDTPHAFAAGDTNAGDTPAVVNGAYTNSFPGSTATTLYTIEAGNNILATQVPPNNGTLNTVGLVGFDIASSGGFTGFDISGASGTAYLVGNNLTGGLTSGSLYTVNLATGAATLQGSVSGLNTAAFRDIAVAPEPTSLAALAGLSVLFRRRR